MKMSKLIRHDVSREEAERRFKEIDDEYKLELLEAIPEGEQVSIYEQGEFIRPMPRCSCSINREIERIQIAKYCRSILAWEFR